MPAAFVFGVLIGYIFFWEPKLFKRTGYVFYFCGMQKVGRFIYLAALAS